MTSAARRDPPLKVEASPSGERGAVRVGLIAALGFVVGIAWPRLFNLQIGPNVPGGGASREAAAPATSSSAAPTPVSTSASATPATIAPGDLPPEPGAKSGQRVEIADGVVESCRNKKGDRIEECGKVAVDRVVKSRLSGLTRCPSAIGLEGTLSVGLSFDFDKSDILVLDAQKSALPSSTVKGVLKCAGEELDGIELEKIPHTHSRYLLRYELKFYPPGKGPEAPSDTAAAGSGDKSAEANEEPGLGTATITWEKALVRESPKDGPIKARIPQGTRVKLLEQKDDWYRIESGKTQGRIYRQSIGK
jgi:hypothetical protein